MKKISAIFLILLSMGFMAGAAHASGFKLIDPAHPSIATGIFSDCKGHSDGGGALALVTYSPAEWVPVSVGGSFGKGLGGASIGLGSSINLLPATKSAFLIILDDITTNNQFTNLKDALKPASAGTTDIKMAIGPAYSLVFYDGLKSRGMWLLFTGCEWKF
jgi:hypothetical protein